MFRKYVSLSLKYAILTISAYLCGFYFTVNFHHATAQIGGLWAVISGILVMEITPPDTLRSLKFRIVGSFIGAVISGCYLVFLPFSVIGLAVCIAAGVLTCHLLRLPDHVKLAGVTISVVMIVSTLGHGLNPIVNAGLRFVESTIGGFVALLTAYSAAILLPAKKPCV
ncbi:aromatic acid exporter family protein [Candidatus Auribacterota bacterium]